MKFISTFLSSHLAQSCGTRGVMSDHISGWAELSVKCKHGDDRADWASPEILTPISLSLFIFIGAAGVVFMHN